LCLHITAPLHILQQLTLPNVTSATHVTLTSAASLFFHHFLALTALKVADISCGPVPALLSAAAKGEASIFALFGRQGNNKVYFNELQSIYNIYKP
jgi:fatty acid synthase subunit alpha